MFTRSLTGGPHDDPNSEFLLGPYFENIKTQHPIFTFLLLSLRIITLKEYDWDLVSIVTEKFTLPSQIIYEQREKGLPPENEAFVCMCVYMSIHACKQTICV